MSIFGKKKEIKPLPLEEMKNMFNSGISDKDIVKNFKKRGYKYEEIQKSMLQIIKERIGSPPASEMEERREAVNAPRQEYREMPKAMMPATAPREEYKEMPGKPQQFPTEMEEIMPSSMSSMPSSRPPEVDEIQPEVLIEEVVEGIVQEKVEQIKKDAKLYGDEINSLKLSIKILTKSIEDMKSAPQPAITDVSAGITEIKARLDDAEARIGGLEKAFKQFLPSLTQNIESLSNLIHEIKEKHSMVEA